MEKTHLRRRYREKRQRIRRDWWQDYQRGWCEAGATVWPVRKRRNRWRLGAGLQGRWATVTHARTARALPGVVMDLPKKTIEEFETNEIADELLKRACVETPYAKLFTNDVVVQSTENGMGRVIVEPTLEAYNKFMNTRYDLETE